MSHTLLHHNHQLPQCHRCCSEKCKLHTQCHSCQIWMHTQRERLSKSEHTLLLYQHDFNNQLQGNIGWVVRMVQYSRLMLKFSPYNCAVLQLATQSSSSRNLWSISLCHNQQAQNLNLHNIKVHLFDIYWIYMNLLHFNISKLHFTSSHYCSSGSKSCRLCKFLWPHVVQGNLSICQSVP